MTFKSNTAYKAGFRTQVTQKQAAFNRFKKRYHASHNPAEKRFLKAEAGRIARELAQFASQWKRFGFGSNSWITRNYKVSNFATSTGSRRTSSRRTTRRSTSRRSHSRRGYSRRGSAWNTGRSSRSSARRSYYVAW